MADISLEARVKAVGLRVTLAELPALRALLADMDRAAQTVRNLRPYSEEPLSAFRLTPAAS
jgi:type II secretory pathway component PulM